MIVQKYSNSAFDARVARVGFESDAARHHAVGRRKREERRGRAVRGRGAHLAHPREPRGGLGGGPRPGRHAGAQLEVLARGGRQLAGLRDALCLHQLPQEDCRGRGGGRGL